MRDDCLLLYSQAFSGALCCAQLAGVFGVEMLFLLYETFIADTSESVDVLPRRCRELCCY